MKDLFLEKIHQRYPRLENNFLSNSSEGDPFHSEFAKPQDQRRNFVLPHNFIPDPEHTSIDPEHKVGSIHNKVDGYLSHMPNLSQMVAENIQTGKQPFSNISVFLVHHLTAEVLGFIAALRLLGCRDLVTVFVGYNPEAAEAYGPDLQDLPSDEFQYFVLDIEKDETQAQPQVSYRVDRRFIKLNDQESAFPFEEFDHNFARKKMNFLESMEALTTFTFLRFLKNTRKQKKHCLIIEDGAYIAPVLNRSVSEKLSLSQLRKKYSIPKDSSVDRSLSVSLEASLKGVLLGSLEHTRNGYDRLMRIQKQCGNLCYPAFTIAVSYVKTQLESDAVAATILNAIESVLFSQGYVLQRRHVHLLGSRGHIGRSLMKYLMGRLDEPYAQVSACDIKVNAKPLGRSLPNWHPEPSNPAVPGCLETHGFTELPVEIKRNLDLIIGVTGGPTLGNSTFEVHELVDWLLKGTKRDLFIASGSTKTAEFPELLAWANELFAQKKTKVTIANRPSYGLKSVIRNRITKRYYGSKYSFNILHSDDYWYPKNIYFLHDLMPINFLYYGVPTEVIEEVLAQLMSASLEMLQQLPLKPRVYAVDFDPEATHKVFRSQSLPKGERIPLVQPHL